MLRDSDKKIFDAVIVWKLDRFGRNREEMAINKVRLRKNGVKVLYAKEHIPDSPEGIILESLLEGLAEYYSANLAQNVKRGLKESALKSESTGGNIPYGYKVGIDKKLHVDPTRAEAVKLIFSMYAQGHTAKQIAETLNSKGYKTATNKKFTEKSFQTMLKNRKYTGVYIYDDITIENGIPAIIDKNTFDLVQQRVEKNKKAPARSKGKVDYVLTTKLFCGDCGLPMIGESGTSKNGSTYHYYKCQGRKKYKTCNMKTVQKDKIEEVVINNTLNKMLTDETIEKIADAVMELHDKELNDSSLLVDLERRKKDIEKALNNLLYAIEQGIITETTKNRLTELEAEKKKWRIK